MSQVTRRGFIAAAAALGATPVWAARKAARSRVPANERRDLFRKAWPRGIRSRTVSCSGPGGPFDTGTESRLVVEMAQDEDFKQVVASATATVSAAADWTCRVLVGNLKPATVYWYRFTDDTGLTSRVGRTITAPTQDDPRPVKFAFVSCQNANDGAQHAYRRMIFEDERAPETDRLGFVLHLGDFIYEDRLVSGRSPAGDVRPAHTRHRQVSPWRKDR